MFAREACAHPGKPVDVSKPSSGQASQSIQLRLTHQNCATCELAGSCIGSLVIIRRTRIRHEQSGRAAGRQFRQRTGTRATDCKVSGGIGFSHAVAKWEVTSHARSVCVRAIRTTRSGQAEQMATFRGELRREHLSPAIESAGALAASNDEQETSVDWESKCAAGRDALDGSHLSSQRETTRVNAGTR